MRRRAYVGAVPVELRGSAWVASSSLVAGAKVKTPAVAVGYGCAAGAGIVEAGARGFRFRGPSGFSSAEASTAVADEGWVLLDPSARGCGSGEVASRWMRDERSYRVGGRRGAVRYFSHSARRRLVFRLSNWRGADRCVVLTTQANQRDAKASGRQLNRWLCWARTRGLLDYVWVRERQGRGAIHYHVWVRGLAACETAVRLAWVRATGEFCDNRGVVNVAVWEHAVRVFAWKGAAWYAIGEASKGYQKAADSAGASAGRFWGCSYSLSRSSVKFGVGVVGGRTIRRWVKRAAREYRGAVRQLVERRRLEQLCAGAGVSVEELTALADRGAVPRVDQGSHGRRADTRRCRRRRAGGVVAARARVVEAVPVTHAARVYAARVSRSGARWLRSFSVGYCMIDRLPGVEERLAAVLSGAAGVDACRLRGRFTLSPRDPRLEAKLGRRFDSADEFVPARGLVVRAGEVRRLVRRAEALDAVAAAGVGVRSA